MASFCGGSATERSTPQRRAKVSAEVRLAAQSVHIRPGPRRESEPRRPVEIEVSTATAQDAPECCSAALSSKFRKSAPVMAHRQYRLKPSNSQDEEEMDFQMRLQAVLEESLSMAQDLTPAKKRPKLGANRLSHTDDEPLRGLEMQRLGVSSWVGECTGVVDGRAFYRCFAKNGHYINVGDCVYVKPEEKDQVSYIMRVQSMWAHEDDLEMQFRGQWLYRPQDTKAGADAALHPREVLLSDWEDDNPIACVQTKCHVAFLKRPPARDMVVEEHFHFVCWRSYNVTSGRIRDGWQEDARQSAEERTAKKLVTQDKVRELERLLWEGKLELVRVRRADGPWARKVLQEAGHTLALAMPTMPIPHISKLLLGNDTETLVLYKGGEAWAAATIRHRPGSGFMEVELLAVKTNRQRGGIGALLIHRLCLLSRDYGYRWMLTSADDTAVPFFKANGFAAKITVPKKDYVGVITAYENSLLMQLDVSSSPYGSRSQDDSALFGSGGAGM